MKISLASIQWMLFMLAGCVVAPITIGEAFQLSQMEIVHFVQRALFVMGIAAILQCLFGHKLPIIEGPAAVWWGIFLLFAGLADTPQEGIRILESLQVGLLISGILFIVLSLTGFMKYVRKLFTPLVTGTFFVLLVAQMSGPFIKGILGIGYLSYNLQGKAAILGVITTICAIVLARSHVKGLRIFSALWTIIGGWIFFTLMNLNKTMPPIYDKVSSIPQVFPWGNPVFHFDMMLVAIISTLLLMTNLIGSIEAVEKAIESPSRQVERDSGFFLGISQLLSWLFATVSFIPVSYTAGFILTTKMKERLPFILGSIVILIISLFPWISMFFSLIPTPVAYAAMFMSFAQMLGMGLKEYTTGPLDERSIAIIGISLMVGIGSMAIPVSSLAEVPPVFVTFLSNGLAMGVVTCIIIEQGWRLFGRKK